MKRVARVWTKEGVLCRLIPVGLCLFWPEAKEGRYGVTTNEGKPIQAHRLVYQLCRGSIPAGMFVCHDCPGGDRPECCNPDHLWLGTPLENWEDMIRKGRGQSIEHIGNRAPRGRGKKRTKKALLSPIPLGPPAPVFVYEQVPSEPFDAGLVVSLPDALVWARSWHPSSRLSPGDRRQFETLVAAAEEVARRFGLQ